jgi:hypothetical protein
MRYQTIALHEEHCDLRDVTCSQCGLALKQKDLQLHVNNLCAKTVVPCSFSAYGCMERVARCLIEEHVSESLQKHCDLLMATIEDERSKSKAELGLLRERITILEEQLSGMLKVNGVPLDQLLDSYKEQMESQQRVIDQFLNGSTIVVDTGGKCGMFSRLQDAINACQDGDTILLRRGDYRENIRSNRQVSIRGSSTETVNIYGTVIIGGPTRLSNVTISNSSDGNSPALRVTGSSPIVEHCHIHSQNLSCAIIDSGAPLLHTCRIFGSRQNGIFWRSEQPGGRVHNCTIIDNIQPNVVVERGSVIFEKCEVRGSKASGMLIKSRGAVVQSCTVCDNLFSNIDIVPGAHAEIVDSFVFRSEKCGIYLGGSALVKSTRVFDNKLPNVFVLGGGNLRLVGSKVLSGLQQGLVVKARGIASIQQSEIRGNCLDNIAAEEGAIVEL